MADSTAITFTCNPLQELLALQGLDMEVGGAMLQYGQANNDELTYKGTLGWRDYGLLENPAKIAQTLEFYEGRVGQVAKTMTTKEIGRSAEIDVSLMCATWEGAKFALGSNTELITQPGSPITTTVDESPPAATNFSIVVASVTGFAANQEIRISTGTSTYGVEWEYRRIRSIDVSGKIIYLYTPLGQLPADGAAVQVVSEKRLITKPCDLPPACQIRIIKYDRSLNKLRIQHAKNAIIKDPVGIDDGDGKVAAKYGFKLNLMPFWDYVANDFRMFTTDYINP